jgi:hypothetical protein
MRRISAGLLTVVACVVLLVVGVVVYSAGGHGLGGVILAVALIGLGLLIAPALSSQGRGAEQQGMMGRSNDIAGFDRPRDQSGL